MQPMLKDITGHNISKLTFGDSKFFCNKMIFRISWLIWRKFTWCLRKH